MARLDVCFKIVATPAGFMWPARLAAFSATENPGFFNQFGPGAAAAPTASRLYPTPFYFQALNKMLAAADYRGAPIRRFPAEVLISGDEPLSVNLTARAFPPGLISLTVNIKGVPLEDGQLDPSELIQWQRAYDLAALDTLIRTTIGMVSARRLADVQLADRATAVPALHVIGVATPPDFPTFVKANKRHLVATVIRKEPWTDTPDPLIESVWNRNDVLNQKTFHECLLIDKQGVVLATSSPDEHEPTWRFSKVSDLLELARITRVLFDRLIRGDQHPSLRYSAHLLSQWVTDPAQMLHASFGHREVWVRLLEEFNLDSAPRAAAIRAVVDGTPLGSGLVTLDTATASQLAVELARLRAQVELISSGGMRIDFVEYDAAEQAARSGDSRAALGHLRLAGGWIKDVALELGASVTAKVLEGQVRF
jgi:hypothetical protein